MTTETKIWTGEVDRSSWPPGPWDAEPDRMQWADEATGLPCLAVRTEAKGHWCGYVGLPVGHPWRDVDLQCTSDAEVHGGITYGPAPCDVGGRICHETTGDDDVRWIGFDCMHHRDRSPHEYFPPGDFQVYRTLEFVRAECSSLAKQVAQAGGVA